MRRHRTRRRGPAAPTVAVQHSTPPAVRRRLLGARFRVVDVERGTLLVNDDSADIEIAEAAWRILAQTGGLLDRGDIARRYGLSRQRTYELTHNKSFPAAVGKVGDRPVWLTLHVDRYREQAQTGRPRGRARKDPPEPS